MATNFEEVRETEPEYFMNEDINEMDTILETQIEMIPKEEILEMNKLLSDESYR